MKYLIRRNVEEARGFQNFIVDGASSKEEALQIFDRVGGEFYDEEIEVTDLSKPTIRDVEEFDE